MAAVAGNSPAAHMVRGGKGRVTAALARDRLGSWVDSADMSRVAPSLREMAEDRGRDSG